MADYAFQLINRNADRPLGEEIRQQLLRRPCVQIENSLPGTASRYRPDEALENAVNTAIAVGEPLLLTGEPGTGKTQAAYYVAHQLGTKVFHFQTKSTSIGNDLLYDFDTVRYFHDAHLSRLEDVAPSEKLDRRKYVSKGQLWQAFQEAETTGYPTVVLIDGNRAPPAWLLPRGCRATTVIGGDGRSLSIAAASIYAKIVRDRLMQRLAIRHPAYGWATNAGYGTEEHRVAITRVGVTRHHRMSFRPLQLDLSG